MSQTILVIDDEEEIRRLLQRALTKYGFETLAAEDAVRGLVMAQDNEVDLVITDIRMPGIDGLDFIGQIHDLKPTLPVIAITGYGSYQTAMEAVKRGAFFFISKPFDNETMIETVRKGLRIPHAIQSGASASLASRLHFTVTASPTTDLSEGVIASLIPLFTACGFAPHTTTVRLPFVIDEMISRAVRAESGEISVEAVIENGEANLSFATNQTTPFDPECLPAADADFDLSTSDGVGLLVAKQYCDHLEFAPDGAMARATFYRDRQANA